MKATDISVWIPIASAIVGILAALASIAFKIGALKSDVTQKIDYLCKHIDARAQDVSKDVSSLRDSMHMRIGHLEENISELKDTVRELSGKFMNDHDAFSQRISIAETLLGTRNSGPKKPGSVS